MLKNAVQSIQDLRGVRNQADQFQVRLGTKISYDQYCSLLLSAAQTYDSQFTTHISTKGPRRSVYDHEIFINENIPCDIDSDVSLLQAGQIFIDQKLYDINFSDNKRAPRMSYLQWTALSPQA